MSDDAMTPHAAAESIQRMGQSASAQILWIALKVIVTAFVAGSIAMGTGYVRDMRDDIKTVAVKADAQDKVQALTTQRVDNQQRVIDQMVLTLQQLGTQINDNRYDIRSLKERNADASKGRQ